MRENRRFEFPGRKKAEKSSKCGVNNGKKCHACDSSEHLIKTCNIYIYIYNEIREITERDMINIMKEYVWDY